MKLEGKKALVTGAGRGIGKAIALLLAKEGAAVAVNSLTAENAAKTTAEINTAGGTAVAVPGDVSDLAAVEEIFNRTMESFGTLDILINNAGISPKNDQGRKNKIIDMPVEEWRRVVDVNLNGMFYCSQAALKIMIPRGEGSILNMSSLAALHYVEITGAHYITTKSGIVGLTKAMAGEASRYGVRVNAIAPGRIQTDLVSNADSELNRVYMQTIPMDRYGRPEEIAEGVLFLVSDAASYVSGAVLSIDGGGIKLG